ncbi:MAG: hypothetical protein ACXVB9_07420 [Bdellovibrionota bacterium]
MKKFLAFLSLALPLSLFAGSLSVKAETAALPRGSRVVSSLEARHMLISEHPQDDGNLRLVIVNGQGRKIQNDNLIGALDRDEDDVNSYNVSMKLDQSGAVVVSSQKDWGTSSWAYHYTIAQHQNGYVVSGFDYSFLSRDKKSGKCSLNLLSGKAVVNGRAQKFAAPDTSLEQADGLELQQICQKLGAN